MNFDLQLFANSTVPANLVREAWAKETWQAAMKNLFFSKFMGNDANSIVQVKEDLKKDKGDNITIPLLMKLKGAGVTGDNKLEGNEEEMIYRDFNISIDQLRNAVRLAGKMEEQKTSLNMRTDAKTSLSTWMSETLDAMFFDALTAAPTADRVIFGGSSTAENALTETDVFSTALIGKAKRIASTDKNAKIRPIKINGGNYYAMVIDPWQARDLRNDEKWINAQKDAANRGPDNPIFTGALGMYEGVVVHENEQCIRTATGASGIKVGHALFLGAQAAVMAVGADPFWEEDEFDYHNQVGFAYGRIMGIKKSKFKFDGTNDTDFGCVNVMTSSKDD